MPTPVGRGLPDRGPLQQNMGKGRDFTVEHESSGAPGKARDSAPQRQAFIDVARELGCDEDEAAFRDKLRVVARQQPEAVPPQTSAPLEKAEGKPNRSANNPAKR